MSEQTKFKVGDRVKYKGLNGTEYGTIVEVNSSIYYNSEEHYQLNGNIWVKWDLDGQILHLSESSMILVQREPNRSIIQKITQIEQQLQELKELLKD